MSRRNPLNDRYVMEKDKQGVSRKSVSNARPKTRAGESTTGTEDAKKKAERKKMSRAERKAADEEEMKTLGPRAREKKLRSEYNRWDVWRRRCVIISFILMFLALAYPFTVYEQTEQTQIISLVLWALPFIAIGAGIYISYAKQRPIGRVLGIKYGREAREEERSDVRAKREKQRRDYNLQEQKVHARVEEKEKRQQEREERRKANKAAEDARKEQFKAAGQAKNKK
ncbi:MAG: hypothetical protein E7000_07070 [Coriobacteriaceae bacterium]|nr:hypothetical protein [Coriobacteriaceae bacterium]